MSGSQLKKKTSIIKTFIHVIYMIGSIDITIESSSNVASRPE